MLEEGKMTESESLLKTLNDYLLQFPKHNTHGGAMDEYMAMRERDRLTRLHMEQREAERKAKLTPLELLQEQIEDLMTGYADYGTEFDEIKELFKQYLALEAGETP
jgi:hypothetical protein